MASFFAELVRRKVFRSAALYLAATWLILQVADIVLDAFDASPEGMRMLIIATVVGFPPFLLLSWLYDLRGTRLVRDTDGSTDVPGGASTRAANITIATLVILGAGLYLFTQVHTGPESEKADPVQEAPIDAAYTIAVMPLANISSDAGDEYLADGLTEELLNVLTSVPQLRVTARTSSFALKDAANDPRSVGQQLSVAHIIRGSVRRDLDQLRVSIQLVNTKTGRSLWSAAYDRKLADIFEIQKDIAERVSGTLQLSLLSDATPIIRRTTPEAYTKYLRALYLYRTYSKTGYVEAAELLQEVLKLDDQYVPAWTLLASVRFNQVAVGQIDHAEGFEKGRIHVERAIEIDPNYAYAISSRAWLAMSYERDFELAARNFKRALELAPNDAAIIGNMAVLARMLGRIDRAIELSRQSLAQNPIAASAFVNLSDQLYQGRRYAAAIASAKRGLELAPESPNAIINLAASQFFAEDPEGALESVKAVDNRFYVSFIEALAHFAIGQHSAADEALTTLIEEYGDRRAAYIAAILAYRGENDDAFRWLQRAIDERQRVLAVRTEPLYDNLRGDSRWPRILEQLGLSDRQIADIDI